MKEIFIRRCRSKASPGDHRRTLLRVDDGGIITYADAQAEAILGYDASDLEGQPISRLVATRQDDPFSPGHRQRLSNGEAILVTLRHHDGYYFTAQLTLRLNVRDSDRAASAYITLRGKQPLDTRLLQPAESHGELGLWELDIPGNQLIWSEGIYHMLDLRPGADLTPEQALFYCQNSQGRLRALFRRCMRTGAPFTVTFDLLTARQHVRRVKLSGRALDAGTPIARLGGSVTDLTGEMNLSHARDHARRLLTAILSASEDLVAAVDHKLNLLCFNRQYRDQFERTFGLTLHEGDNLRKLLEPFPNERRLSERLWQRAFERDTFVVEMPIAQLNDEAPVFEFHFQPLKDADGDVIGAVHVARDISERVRSASHSHFLNQHDPVTGLLNRREFIQRLERLLARPGQGQSHGLLFLDLDDFARFDHACGNGACDRFLRALASALGTKVRQRDALARLAGDTFALLIENCSEGEARRVADNLLTLTSDFVFEWQERPLQTTASAGLLMLGDGASEDPEQLLGEAGDLCHTAKIAGRNRVHTGQAAGSGNEQQARAVLTQLQHSLDNDGLALHYQPLRPVTSATWGDHIEILVRIPAADPELPPLQPTEFLPIAERFDLAKQLDRQVIRKTLNWLVGQPLLEPRLKYCGFNLSQASVLDDSFADFMESMLNGLPFAPECFCLEIREKDATQYPDDVATLCDALHRVGCRVALDGAGASVESYALAARLPVDIIKLDESMMENLLEDPVKQVMVEAIHKIAQQADRVTVATAIETDDALRWVRTLGIDFGQGFRLARPQPILALTPATVQLETGQIGG